MDLYGSVGIVAVSGMGKTQLARAYAKTNYKRYELVWFFDCSLNIEDEFVKLARKINVMKGKNLLSQNKSLAKREVMEFLSDKKDWLLIMDNNKIGQNDKIQDIIDWEHNGHIIFCCQDGTSLKHFINILAFNKQDSVKLIKKILKKPDSELANFLAEEFKGYPATMVHGAQLINNVEGLSKEEYKKRILNDESDKIKLNVKIALESLTPSARDLINKIALINNQNFSKDLLSVISDNKENLENDLYLLSKSALISTVKERKNKRIFETHDTISHYVLGLYDYGSKVRQLENIINNLTTSMPSDALHGYIFRTAVKTMDTNLSVIHENSKKYKPNIYRLMELNFFLLSDYIGTGDNDKAKELVDWFEEERKNLEKRLRTNREKSLYSGYLAMLSSYYRELQDYDKSIKYCDRAKEIMDTVSGYHDVRSDLIYMISRYQICTGKTIEAARNIGILKTMIKNQLIHKHDLHFVELLEAYLLSEQGEFPAALKKASRSLQGFIELGVERNNLAISSIYLLKAELLNRLYKYSEAFETVDFLYETHKSFKTENHEIFGNILAQKALSHLGLQDYATASENIEKSISILLENKKITHSSDKNLAKAYSIRGKIYFATDKYSEALKDYKDAISIYKNLYEDRIGQACEAIYIISEAAKSAYYCEDFVSYEYFYDYLKSLVGSKNPKITELENINTKNKYQKLRRSEV